VCNLIIVREDGLRQASVSVWVKRFADSPHYSCVSTLERSFHMARSAKTVSVRHLHAAIKTALEAAKKKHPDFKFEPGDGPSGPGTIPIYYRFPWICGYPPDPWINVNLQNLAEFNQTFVANLASNPQISALGVDGKFDAALYVSGDKVAVGFTPGDVSFTE
jgi:hypothetical protein